MKKGFDSVMDQVKRDLSNPVPEHNAPSKEKRMATKVKKADKVEKPEADEAPKGKKATKVEKKAKAGKAAKADEDGSVSLSSLATEAGISTAAARRKIRATEMERDGRWTFKEGSKSLKTARNALGLDA